MSGIVIIIASKGRPLELGAWIDHVARQSLQPMAMLWCVSEPADLPDMSDIPAERRPMVHFSAAGSCIQRNVGLHSLPEGAGIAAFFDDDYVPSRSALAGIARIFAQHPDVAGVTGTVLADGICTPGIPPAQAEAMVRAHDASGAEPTDSLRDVAGLYGCNMAIRLSLAHGLLFDERLPLYAWQEDVDFGVRLAARGRVCHTDAFAGVHCGTKRGRTSGRRMGYSQIVNPAYLLRKGTGPRGKMLGLMARNMAMNHVRALFPEPYIDRLGRVAGNWRGIADLVRGRIDPERVVEV